MFCRTFFKILFVAGFLIFTVGCTKESPNSTANLNFNFQSKNSALSHQIEVVIVNVTGPGISNTIFKEVNCEDEPCGSVSVEVPAGDSRLIQVLAVIKQTGNPIRFVTYGDQTKTLSAGDEPVSIQLQHKADFSREARMMGRYVATAGELQNQMLTGFVTTKVFVEPGKPPMKINTFEIFGGWFNTFLLDGIPFVFEFSGFNAQGTAQYVNAPIFKDLHPGQNGLTLLSPGVAANSNIINHYTSSLPFFDEEDNVYVQKSFRNKVVGFFGANPGNLHLCAEQIPQNFLFDGDNGSSELCKDGIADDCSAYYRWGNGTTTNDLTIVGSANGLADNCTGAPTERKVNIKEVGEDGDEFIGYKGAFRKEGGIAGFTNNAGMFSFDQASGVVQWMLLGGVFLPGGIDVFFRPNSNNLNFDAINGQDDAVICEKLPEQGFGLIGNVPTMDIQGKTGGILQFPGPLPNSDFHIVLCPRSASGGYFRTAFHYQHHGHNNPGNFPVRVTLKKPKNLDSSNSTIMADVCYPLVVNFLNEDQEDAKAQNPINVILQTNDPTGQFFRESNECDANTMAISSVNLDDKTTVYYRHNTTDSSLSYKVFAQAVGLSGGAYNYRGDPKQTPNEFRIVSEFFRAQEFEVAEAEFCVPFLVGAFYNGELTGFPTGSSVSFSLAQDQMASPTDVFDTLPNCVGSSPTASGAPALANQRSGIKNYFLNPNLIGSAFAPVDNVISSCHNGSNAVPCSNEQLDVVSTSHDFYSLSVVDGPPGWENGLVTSGCYELEFANFEDHYPNPYPVFYSSGNLFPDAGGTHGTFYNVAGCPGANIIPDGASYGLGGMNTHRSIWYRPNRQETLGGLSVSHDLGVGNATVNAPNLAVSTPSNSGRINNASGAWIEDYSPGGIPVYSSPTSVTLTLENTGTGAITSITETMPIGAGTFDYLGGAYPGTGGTCAVSLAPGATCDVVLEITNGLNTQVSGVIRFTYDDPNDTGIITDIMFSAVVGP